MIEWETVTTLTTPAGSLTLNDTENERYLLRPTDCKARRSLRVTSDKVPQADGEIFHKRFADGTELHLSIELWYNGLKACEGTGIARQMVEELVLHLNAMLNDDGRLIWSPSGYSDNRMLDRARYLSPLEVVIADDGHVTVEFDIDSPYPYTLDVTQPNSPTGIECPNSVPTVITMDGNVNFAPVIQADGPLSTFWIENQSLLDDDGLPLTILYDAARPGADAIPGGSYIEFEVFRNTAYLNGDGANMKPGVDPEETDYFMLKPGDNTILATGCDARFLVNNAWSVA